MDLLFLSQDEVRDLVDPDRLIEALADAFKALSGGTASLPPRSAAVVQGYGWLGVMPGYLPGTTGGLEVKLVSVFPHNHERGLPAHVALIALFDEKSGVPLAVMDGTYITAARTAAASALSVRLLAREESKLLAVLGAGVQGRAHLEAVSRVHPFAEIRVASRNVEHAQALAEMHPSATAATSLEEAVRDADVVCVCTDSAEPVLRRAWLQDGAHIASVGLAEEGSELDPMILNEARLFVESRIAFQPFPAGAPELQPLNPERGAELGEVLLGRRPGRRSDGELTLYKSVGVAIEDVVAARLAYETAKRQGVGAQLKL